MPSDDERTPFDSIEGAHEYVRLLAETILDTRASIDAEIIERSRTPGVDRQLDALRLVNYKLSQLQEHFAASRRILNDLRTLRRLLLAERVDTSD